MMLVAAAAARWGVPPAECRAEKSAVIHDRSGRRLTFGDLAEEAGRLALPRRVRLKDPREFRLIGTDPPRPEFEAAVRASRFASDGAARQVIAVSSGHQAWRSCCNVEAAPADPGVVPRQVANGVAVVARTPGPPRAGESVRSPGTSRASNEIQLRSGNGWGGPGCPLPQSGAMGTWPGTAGARRHQATYETPFARTRHGTDDLYGLVGWSLYGMTPTQDQTGAREAGARAGVATW
jgi:isoquinoline 1-oxidoreductase beta subunit